MDFKEAQPVRTVSMSVQRMRDAVGEVMRTMSYMRVITDAELQNIRRTFEQHDQDMSETIDIDELRNVMGTLGSTPSDAQLKDLVEQVTTGDTQELHFPEFLRLILLYKEAVQYSFLETDSGQMTRAQRHIHNANRKKLPLPDSASRLAVDCVIAVATLYVVVSALLAAVRPVGDGVDDRQWIDLALSSVVFVFDILISGFTCYVDPTTGEVFDKPVQCFTQYIKRPDFIIDLSGLVPWELWPDLRWLRCIKFLKIASVFRTRRPTGKVRMDEQYVWLHYTFVFQFRLLLMAIGTMHAAACMFCYLQQGNSRGDYDYVSALYWVLYTVSTVGYGDVTLTSREQRVFAMGLFVFSVLVNGFVISEIGSFLSRADVEEEQRGKMRETVAALQAFGIPRALRAEILSFQWHQLRSNISAQSTELLQGLPEQMQDGMGLYVRMRIIACVPLFRRAHPGCRIALAQSLTTVVAAPEEYIIVCGETGNEMYFLGHGYVDVLRSDGHVICTLSQGHFFGEIALLTNLAGATGGIRTASIKALSYCDLFKLDRHDFFVILQRFPRFRESIKQEMRRAERRVSKAVQQLPRMSITSPGAGKRQSGLTWGERVDSSNSPGEELTTYRMPLDGSEAGSPRASPVGINPLSPKTQAVVPAAVMPKQAIDDAGLPVPSNDSAGNKRGGGSQCVSFAALSGAERSTDKSLEKSTERTPPFCTVEVVTPDTARATPPPGGLKPPGPMGRLLAAPDDQALQRQHSDGLDSAMTAIADRRTLALGGGRRPMRDWQQLDLPGSPIAAARRSRGSSARDNTGNSLMSSADFRWTGGLASPRNRAPAPASAPAPAPGAPRPSPGGDNSAPPPPPETAPQAPPPVLCSPHQAPTSILAAAAAHQEHRPSFSSSLAEAAEALNETTTLRNFGTTSTDTPFFADKRTPIQIMRNKMTLVGPAAEERRAVVVAQAAHAQNQAVLRALEEERIPGSCPASPPQAHEMPVRSSEVRQSSLPHQPTGNWSSTSSDINPFLAAIDARLRPLTDEMRQVTRRLDRIEAALAARPPAEERNASPAEHQPAAPAQPPWSGDDASSPPCRSRSITAGSPAAERGADVCASLVETELGAEETVPHLT